MLFSLLEGETDAGNSGSGTPNYLSLILIGVVVVVLIVSMFLMNRRSKKREQDAQQLINAVKPGNKVKTIGGICGIVVEVNPEEDTFVLETGSEESGKSYMKFVRQAILESDAVIEKAPAVKEEVAEASAEPFENTADVAPVVVDQPVEEVKAEQALEAEEVKEEVKEEEVKVEEVSDAPKKSSKKKSSKKAE